MNTLLRIVRSSRLDIKKIGLGDIMVRVKVDGSI